MRSIFVSFFLALTILPAYSRAEAPKGGANSPNTASGKSVSSDSGKIGANQKPDSVQNNSSGRGSDNLGYSNTENDRRSENSEHFRHNDNNEEAPVPNTIRRDPPLAKP